MIFSRHCKKQQLSVAKKIRYADQEFYWRKICALATLYGALRQGPLRARPGAEPALSPGDAGELCVYDVRTVHHRAPEKPFAGRPPPAGASVSATGALVGAPRKRPSSGAQPSPWRPRRIDPECRARTRSPRADPIAAGSMTRTGAEARRVAAVVARGRIGRSSARFRCSSASRLAEH